jgi:hypothetical protein
MTTREVLLQALASTPSDIERLITSMDSEVLLWRSDASGWSCQEIINRLIDWEQTNQALFNFVLNVDEPRIHRTAGAWPQDDALLHRQGSVEDFRRARADTLDLLRRLGPGDWQRAAYDEDNSRITLRYLAQDLVNHDIELTSQLTLIIQRRQAHGQRSQSTAKR